MGLKGEAKVTVTQASNDLGHTEVLSDGAVEVKQQQRALGHVKIEHNDDAPRRATSVKHPVMTDPIEVS